MGDLAAVAIRFGSKVAPDPIRSLTYFPVPVLSATQWSAVAYLHTGLIFLA